MPIRKAKMWTFFIVIFVSLLILGFIVQAIFGAYDHYKTFFFALLISVVVVISAKAVKKW